jgi:Domain of unknown function (DUF4158)
MSASRIRAGPIDLPFAVLLLFFRANGRFPEVAEILPSVLALVAQQLGIDTEPMVEQA